MKNSWLILTLLVVGMVVATELGDENNAVDVLVDQIQEMQSSIHDEMMAHQNIYDDQQVQCDEEIAFRKQEIEDADLAFSTSQAALNRCENAQVTAREDHAKIQGFIVSIHEILSNLEVKRNSEHDAYVSLVEQQLNPALESIQGIYPILDGLVEGVTSFVQLSSHVNRVFKQMIKMDKTETITPIVTFLVQTNQLTENEVSQFIDLIQKIEDDLQGIKNSAVAFEDSAAAEYQALLANYSNKLSELNTLNRQLSDYEDSLAKCVTDETAVSEAAAAKSQHNNSSLNHAIDLCLAQTSEFVNSTNDNSDELAILDKLRDFVKEQGELFEDFGDDRPSVLQEYKDSLDLAQSTERAEFLETTMKRFKKSAPCENCKKGFLQKSMGF